jgi:hypothetical protein
VIARICHGYTKPEPADAYEAMLKPERLPGISKANGDRGQQLAQTTGWERGRSSQLCSGTR